MSTASESPERVLRAADPNALYHLPGGGAANLCAAALRIGHVCVRVDFSRCLDKAALLAAMAEALRFPPWFGENWDALADCLTDLSWLPAAGYVLVLEHGDTPRRAAAADFLQVLDILSGATRSWAAERTPFRVFVELSTDARRGLEELLPRVPMPVDPNAP